MAGLLDLLGWDGLTPSEQLLGVAGGAGGLALVLLGWVLFGGGRRR